MASLLLATASGSPRNSSQSAPILPRAGSTAIGRAVGGQSVSDPMGRIHARGLETGERAPLSRPATLSGEQVFVTPVSPRGSKRDRTPSPPKEYGGSYFVTPMNPSGPPPLQSKADGMKGVHESELEAGCGSEDESHLEVTVKTDEGTEYIALAAIDGFALVPDEVLASKLFGEEWRGSMTVKKENGRVDETPLWLDDRVFWRLKPGSYVAQGVRRLRGNSRSSGVGGADPRRRISGAMSSFGAVSSVGACSKGGGGLLQRPPVSVATRAGAFGGSGRMSKGVSKSNKEDKSGLEDEVSSGTPSVSRKERENRESTRVGGETVKVRESEVASSVLRGGLRKQSLLRKSVERWDSENKDIPVVNHIPYPLQGDQIFVKDLENSLLEKGEDKGSHWSRGYT